jgi:hypothetical protein
VNANVANMESQRLADTRTAARELTDKEMTEAVETALRIAPPRLRERIVSAAGVVMAEEGYDFEDFVP